MSALIEASDLASAWVKTLRAVHDKGGTGVNVMTVVATPTLVEHAGLRAVLDANLHGQSQRGKVIYSVDTVANTIFPSALYKAPEGAWTVANAEPFDDAAERLYKRYRTNYPLLKKIGTGSNRGTYFGRLVAWDVVGGEPLNQLDLRIQNLRKLHRNRYTQWNTTELVLSGPPEAADARTGLQLYTPKDHPHQYSRGFPCLAHVDVSLFGSKLHLTAVYRHQALITKGYGNLLGLARLQQFMAQQSGYGIGELCVIGGFSDAEWGTPWSKNESKALLAAAEGAIAQ